MIGRPAFAPLFVALDTPSAHTLPYCFQKPYPAVHSQAFHNLDALPAHLLSLT